MWPICWWKRYFIIPWMVIFGKIIISRKAYLWIPGRSSSNSPMMEMQPACRHGASSLPGVWYHIEDSLLISAVGISGTNGGRSHISLSEYKSMLLSPRINFILVAIAILSKSPFGKAMSDWGKRLSDIHRAGLSVLQWSCPSIGIPV